MKISVFLSYSGYAQPNDNIARTLSALRMQSLQPHEIIVADNSDSQQRVVAWCGSYGAKHLSFPFSHYAYVYSANYNACFEVSSGDAIVLLCSNWILAPNWLDEQAKWLSELGQGNLVTTENDRRALVRAVGEAPRDWFADYPKRFEYNDPNYIDNAKLMIHRQDWLPFDVDFDPPVDNSKREAGNMHGLIEWGARQIVKNRLHFWFRRDLQMLHQRSPRSEEDVAIRIAQEGWSRRIFDSKIRIAPDVPRTKPITTGVDFDGVLYAGGAGFLKQGCVVPGALEAVKRLLETRNVFVFTARKDTGAVYEWLKMQGFPLMLVTNTKLPADEYIDDNAQHFNNWTETLAQIEGEACLT